MTEIRAFILAAGLGERLRPITHHIPKALVPVCGRPVIERVAERIAEIRPLAIGINASYKRESIRQWIEGSAHKGLIRFFPEETVLGTGGALKNAEGFLSGSDFIVHNSDIISDIDLKGLVEFHRKSSNIATLAVHKRQEFNNLIIDNTGLLRDIAPEGNFAFTGIAVYSPEFLSFLPQGHSNVTDTWLAALAQGMKIGSMDITGCYWTDIGTPQRYASAVFFFMHKEGESVFVSPEAKGCARASVEGYVDIEGECTLEGSSLKNVIVLEGGFAKSGKRYENAILGPDFEIKLSEKEVLDFAITKEGLLIGAGGSERKYYRTSGGVLLKCQIQDLEFERQIALTEFFLRFGVPVPIIYWKDELKKTALIEDLGDITLYSWLKCKPEPQEIKSIYKSSIKALVSIHHIPLKETPLCLKERFFDYEHLRWESTYFIERFLNGLRGLGINPSELEADLHKLAKTVDAFPKGIMHRDYQSQNIMVKNSMVRIIDYQGARIGPQAYDIVSLLWDPYSRLTEDVREELIEFYIEEMRKTALEFDEKSFRDWLLPCRLQRHMQALGAYARLSSEGKTYFLKHIPEAVRLLKEDIALCSDLYPALSAVVERL